MGDRAETREEIVARVTREQERLHPAPVYGPRSRRRLRAYLIAIFPVAAALAWVAGTVLGWGLPEVAGFAGGLVLALGYIGYVLITERDDGRIHDEVSRVVSEREPE